MKPLALAIVGVGYLGRIHARLASRLDGVRLAAVVDPDAKCRDEAAAETGAPAAADYRDVADRFDAAVVAAPTALHHQIGMDLLSRGKHLLVEKPLAANFAHCRQLADEAARRHLILQVGHVERFNPAFVHARPHLDDPKYIEATRAGGFTCRSTDVGVVLDLMIHDLDLVLSLVDAPLENVEAMGLALLGRHEDVAHARLTFGSGCVASLSASRVSPQATRRMYVWSRRSYAGIDFAGHCGCLVRPSQAVLRRTLDVARLPLSQRQRLAEGLFTDVLPCEHFELEPGNAIEEELREFAHGVRTGRPPRVDGHQAARAVEVAEQILAAISAHRWDGPRATPRGPLAMPTAAEFLHKPAA